MVIFSQKLIDCWQTRHNQEKPHPDSFLVYVICQRLLYHALLIPIGSSLTFLTPSPAVCSRLIHMLPPLLHNDWALLPYWNVIADSIWSYPNYVVALQQLKWKFTSSSNVHSSKILTAFYNVSSAHRSVGQDRTFFDDFLALQVYLNKCGTSAIISNASGPKYAPLPF